MEDIEPTIAPFPALLLHGDVFIFRHVKVQLFSRIFRGSRGISKAVKVSMRPLHAIWRETFLLPLLLLLLLSLRFFDANVIVECLCAN